MTFSKTFHPSVFLGHLSETERKTVSEISEEAGCSQNTTKNALKSLEREWMQKENKGEPFEWKVLHETVSGKIMIWWKEKQLTESEIREEEIGELKRLMEKYPEIVTGVKRWWYIEGKIEGHDRLWSTKVVATNQVDAEERARKKGIEYILKVECISEHI